MPANIVSGFSRRNYGQKPRYPKAAPPASAPFQFFDVVSMVFAIIITLDALTGILALVALKPMRKSYLAGK